MRIVGLTGSIGMGKSAAADYLRFLGIPVYDADAAVHTVYARGGAAVGPVGAIWPEAVCGGAIDRAALSALIADDRSILPRLEGIVHPIVRKAQERFLLMAALRRAPAIALDIPLLFETGGERRCDAVFVVSAPGFVQQARVLARPEMTPEKLALILSRQTSDAEKCARADFVIPTHRAGGRCSRRCTGRCAGFSAARPGTGRPTRRWRRHDPSAHGPFATAQTGNAQTGNAQMGNAQTGNAMREIVLDTETTGLDPAAGHRIVEIGAIELQHHLPTGKEYHVYLDPEREMPDDAYAVHGLSSDFSPARTGSPTSPRISRVHRRRAARHPQRRLRSEIRECRASPDRPRSTRRNPRDRYRPDRTAEVSRRPRQSRRPVPAVRNRPHRSRQAWRADRFASLGGGLSGTGRRAPAGVRSGRRRRTVGRGRDRGAPSAGNRGATCPARR